MAVFELRGARRRTAALQTLYIKLGKRITVTIRKLGYPTKNALKSWHREYAQRLDAAFRARHTGHLVPLRRQAGHDPASDHSRCASQKDSHDALV